MDSKSINKHVSVIFKALVYFRHMDLGAVDVYPASGLFSC